VQLFSQPAVRLAAQLAVQQKCLSLERRAALWLTALLVGVGRAVPCTAERNLMGVDQQEKKKEKKRHASNCRQLVVPSNRKFFGSGLHRMHATNAVSEQNETFSSFHKLVFSLPVQIMYLQNGRRCQCWC